MKRVIILGLVVLALTSPLLPADLWDPVSLAPSRPTPTDQSFTRCHSLIKTIVTHHHTHATSSSDELATTEKTEAALKKVSPDDIASETKKLFTSFTKKNHLNSLSDINDLTTVSQDIDTLVKYASQALEGSLTEQERNDLHNKLLPVFIRRYTFLANAICDHHSPRPTRYVTPSPQQRWFLRPALVPGHQSPLNRINLDEIFKSPKAESPQGTID